MKNSVNIGNNDKEVKKLSVKQVDEVFKQLNLPTTVIPLQKNIEPFEQFSLLKYVDMVVGTNKTDADTEKQE